MNDRETAKAAKEELDYQSSAQAVIDRLVDRQIRVNRDKASGHSSLCSLTKCHFNCKKR